MSAVEYTYDAFGRRIEKAIDADGDGYPDEVERFVYDGDHIALVFDENNTLIYRYLHGFAIDQVLAQEDANGEVLWALADNQGSVEYLVDSGGNIVKEVIYDSFGRIESDSAPNVEFRFGYTGREHDEETGLIYYRTRYYNPETGRFLSEDTIGFAGGDANLYRYVGNSPLDFIDPHGENPARWLQQQVQRAVEGTLRTIADNDATMGALNQADRFLAGFASGASGGLSDAARARLYGDLATRNQSGWEYNVGNLVGTGLTIAVSAGSGWAAQLLTRISDAIGTAQSIHDAARSIADIIAGCGDGGDVLNILLPLFELFGTEWLGDWLRGKFDGFPQIGDGPANIGDGPGLGMTPSGAPPDLPGGGAPIGDPSGVGGSSRSYAPLTLDDLTPELSELSDATGGLSFERKHRNKHLPNTPQSDRLVRQGKKEVHIFNDAETMSRVEAEILTRGEFTGTARDTLRFGLMFDEPIGTRIAPNGTTIPLHYGEIKVNPTTGLYHVTPRTGPARE